MPKLVLSDFSAVTFDVYGTRIDWEPSIITLLSDWAGRNDVSTPDRCWDFDLPGTPTGMMLRQGENFDRCAVSEPGILALLRRRRVSVN